MATIRKENEPEKPRRAPATTPEGRENQLISLAVDLVEKQLRDGTASSQIITQYIKLGTTRERLEQEKLRRENLMLQAKVEQISSQQRSEEMYAEAMKAFSTYSGRDEEEYDD